MKASDILLDGFFQNESGNPRAFKQSIIYYLRYWKWFLLSMLFCLSLSFVYLYYYVPVYSVSSTIMLKDDSKGSRFFENPVVGELEEFKSSQITENEVDVLGSAELVNEVLNGLSYFNLYYSENSLGKLSAMPDSKLPFNFELLEVAPNRFEQVADWKVNSIHGNTINYSVDGTTKDIQFGKAVKSDFGIFVFEKNELTDTFKEFPIIIKFHSKDELTGVFGGGLKVEAKDKTSSIIYITMDTQFPERGVAILNGLVDSYNKNALDEKKEVVLSTLNFLDVQLSQLSVDLAMIQQNIERFKNQRNVVDIENDSRVYQESALEATKQADVYQNQLEILNNVKSELNANEDRNITLGPLANDDPALLNMIEEFNRELNNLNRLKRTVLPENPVYVNSQNSLKNFREKINSHIQNRISALEVSIRNVETTTSTFSRKSSSAPMLEREYEALTRDLEIKKEHYLFLIKKKEETSLYLASVPTVHSKTINKASFYPVPVNPKPSLIYSLAFLLALVVPFGFLYFRRSFNEKLEDKESIFSVLPTTMLGELSEMPKNERGLVMNDSAKTPISEQIRYVRTSYCLHQKSESSQVILITSTISGEGKTFFAMNFAKSLAMIGKKTAVLSYDLRKPQTDGSLVDLSAPSLSSFLGDTSISVDELLSAGIHIHGFTFFQSGKVPKNPAELMVNGRNKELFYHLRQQYDYIIVDSSPVGQVADALSLVPLVDSTIYIMRYNWTSKQDVEFFQQLKQEEKLIEPLVVLNGSKVGQGYSYGYYQQS